VDKYKKTEDWIPTDLKARGLYHRYMALSVSTADPLTYDAFIHILFTPPEKFDFDLIENLKKKMGKYSCCGRSRATI